MILYTFLAVLLLCVAHIFTHKLKFTNIPRSKWLSVAGGISVAYIFLAAFPELNEIQQEVSEKELFNWHWFAEIEVYLLALLGLTFFYGLENRAKKSKESNRDTDSGKKKNLKIFWIHISSFCVYNFIIGYLLLHSEEESFNSIFLYAIAMAFHFIVTDHALEDHFHKSYIKRGRWILVSAVFLGWLASIFISIPEIYIGVIFAFLAGGVIMNVLKEELPKERESNLMAFCLGVIGYAAVIAFSF